MSTGRLFPARRSDDVSINLTPLIDVVFILLIFFMVTTTFQRQSELDVELPAIAESNAVPATERVDVVIDARGRIAIDGRTLLNAQAATVRRALSAVLDPGSDQVVVLTTDAQTPSGSILPVLQIIGALGHARVAFAARVDDTSTQAP